MTDPTGDSPPTERSGERGTYDARPDVDEDDGSDSTLSLFRYFLGAYPARSASMVILMLGAGLAEGAGVLSLVPVLQLADSGGAGGGRASDIVTSLFGLVGLEVTLPTLLGFIVLAITLKAVLLFFAQRQVGFTVAGVVRDFRLNLMGTLLAARWSYFARKRPGQFANAIATEARRSAAAYQQACAAIAAIFQMAAYMAVALMLSWAVAIGAVMTGVLLTLVAGRFFRLSRTAGRRTTRSARQLAASLVDVLQGVKALKAMGREGLVWPLLEHETESLNQASRDTVIATQALRSLQEPFLTLVLACGLYVLIAVSGMPFSSTLVMAFVFFRLVSHANTLQVQYQGILSGESAFFSFQQELEAASRNREDWPGTRKVEGVLGEIRFEDVSFAYGEKTVLDHVDAVLPPRSLIAIHGESGAGKTTFGDLLAGLHRPGSGRIMVGNVALEELDLSSWRAHLGYVPQETLLFTGTILENITLGDERYTRKDAEIALEQAGAWGFVESRLGGLDAEIGNRGSMLSGGQRQRLALARALVGKPVLLLLDEVTSGLDPATEQRICDTLDDLRRSMTIVSISHRDALREIADVVFVMSGGQLVQAEPVA